MADYRVNVPRFFGRPVFEFGVQKAMIQVKWDQEASEERGGMCAWSRDADDSEAYVSNEGGESGGCGSGLGPGGELIS